MTSYLLVADSPWVRNDVLAALTDPTATVDTVEDPADVVDRAAERRYDAIVVDLQVGSMGGMAVVRALRDAIVGGDVRPTPIVLLLDRHVDAFLAKRAGAAGWLVKPFTSQDLRTALEALAPTRG